MSATSLGRPVAGDHAPYYDLYVDQVPAGDVLETLRASLEETRALLAGRPAAWARHRYAPDKWSVAEVVGHLVDTERTFAHRAFVIARQDPVAPPDMDQDGYARVSNADQRPLDDLVAELAAVRGATLALFASFDDAIWSRHGTAAGRSFAVRSFPFVVAGHEIHHRRVLVERYVSAVR